MLLTDQIIHDEANSSVSSDSVQIDRQLPITSIEFERKWLLLERIVALRSLGKQFVRVERNSSEKASTKLELVLFTEDGAGLTVNLVAYGNGKNRVCYFGTRGSPTKLFSGQNLLEIKESNGVDTLALKLNCSKFEAMSLYGFWLFFKAVKEQFQDDFFTQEERTKLRQRKVGVYSVGYATYEDFGNNRDQIFSLLVAVTSKFPVQRSMISLTEMYGVKATSFGKQSSDGSLDKLTTLVLKKYADGKSLCSQTLYLKEKEVEAKSNSFSGKKNKSLMDKIGVKQLETHVRFDNVFYAPYLKRWLNAVGSSCSEDSSVTLDEISPLFSSNENIKTMVSAMKQEMGLRTLLLAPTLERISFLATGDRSPLSKEEKLLLQKWFAVECIVKDDRLHWECFTASNERSVARLAQRMFVEEYLDLSLPVFLYGQLDALRMHYCATVDEQNSLNHATLGYTGFESKIKLSPEIQSRLKLGIRKDLKTLRANIPTLTAKSLKSASKLLTLD
jgi:hypothetical protein